MWYGSIDTKETFSWSNILDNCINAFTLRVDIEWIEAKHWCWQITTTAVTWPLWISAGSFALVAAFRDSAQVQVRFLVFTECGDVPAESGYVGTKGQMTKILLVSRRGGCGYRTVRHWQVVLVPWCISSLKGVIYEQKTMFLVFWVIKKIKSFNDFCILDILLFYQLFTFLNIGIIGFYNK